MINGERLRDASLEWLEADGLGGFASGTVPGQRTRRYHGLLCVATTPPTGRRMLVNAVETWVDAGRGPCALSSHRYLPDVTHPDCGPHLVAFAHEPFPTWTFELADGLRIVHELFVPRDSCEVVLSWRIEGARRPAKLVLRPLLSQRDAHALRREDGALDLTSRVDGRSVRWQLERGAPAVRAVASGAYRADPTWYRDFLYEEERARGYDHVEDLASPGLFEHDLGEGDAFLVLAAELGGAATRPARDAHTLARELRARELARRMPLTPLDRAAESFLVKRGDGLSLIAGYPWFTDWGRDTFLSLRGLCLARGRVDEAVRILLAWAEHVSQGMLPNRFPDQDAAPEYNSVDASLWYAVAVEETLAAARDLARAERERLEKAVLAILAGYAGGTRHGIRADADGLIACGEPGVQLTWMDAKVGGEVVTPRTGKPVEVQALWIQALGFGARFDRRWRTAAQTASASFAARFWNDEHSWLNDVVDCDHERGTVDATLRPNQLLAIGGLARPLLEGERARRVVEAVERELSTPLGVRTLPPRDPRYRGRYEGDLRARDHAYHQGTAWPWLTGPFVEAWVRVRGSTDDAKRDARQRFLAPLAVHMGEAGLGHVSEIADGDAPHTPRGAPFQAWSLGEYLRLDRVVLAPT